MITERHNVAARKIIEALSRGSFSASLCFKDVGSHARLINQRIDTTDVANRVLLPWMLPHLSDEERRHSSCPDAIVINREKTCSTQFTTNNSALKHSTTDNFSPKDWKVHLIEFKYCEDNRPQNQLLKAQEQHARPISVLRSQAYNKVHLHTILNGVMGTINVNHTDRHFQEIGLNYCQIKTLNTWLNKHAVQYAIKLIKTRYALHNSHHARGEDSGASARNPHDPHWFINFASWWGFEWLLPLILLGVSSLLG